MGWVTPWDVWPNDKGSWGPTALLCYASFRASAHVSLEMMRARSPPLTRPYFTRQKPDEIPGHGMTKS